MVIDAKGKDKRGNGTAGAHVTATMTDAGSGSTRVEVVTDLNITGKPAQFGRGVMQDVSDKLLGQFTACLEKKVGDRARSRRQPPRRRPTAAAAAPGSCRGLGRCRRGDPERQGEAGGSTSASSSACPRRPTDDDALDLGATVLPVLAKAYWKQALGVVLALLVLRRLLGR